MTVNGAISMLDLLAGQFGEVVQSTPDSAMNLLGEPTAWTRRLATWWRRPAGRADPAAGEMADIAEASRGTCEASEQGDLIGRLELFTGQVTNSARGMVTSSSTVHGLTTNMMAGCQTQDVERQMIEHVVGALDQLGVELNTIADVLAGRADVDGIAAVEAALDRVKARYVMHCQHRAHAETLGGTIAADGPQIELL